MCQSIFRKWLFLQNRLSKKTSYCKKTYCHKSSHKKKGGEQCILMTSIKIPWTISTGLLRLEAKAISFLNFDMCTIMYTPHTYVLSAGNNCFPVKMLQDSLFATKKAEAWPWAITSSQFCYKDHKINVSAITKFQCLIYITCFSVSIVGKNPQAEKSFIRDKWKNAKKWPIAFDEFARQGDYFSSTPRCY